MILLAAPSLAASLSGTVTDENGTVVAGATVVAYDTRLNYATATTTSDGSFGVSGVPAGRYRLRAMPVDTDPRVDRFYPEAWDFCDGEVVEVGPAAAEEGLDFTLPVGGSLGGRLVSDAGEPIAGAELLAIGQSERTQLVNRLGETDADGNFSVVGLDSEPGASEPYAVYVAASGYPKQYLAPTYDEDTAALFDVVLGEEGTTGDQPLLPGITVSGTVYGPDGAVDNGTIYAYCSSQVLTTSIAADGTWTADGLPPGDFVAWAASDGLATTYYPDADRPGERVSVPDEGQVQTGVDLTLPDESTLTVTLVAEGDLSEASVLLYNDTYTVGRGGALDEDGHVTIDALHPGTYYLFVYGSDLGYTDDYLRDDAGALQPVVVDGETAITVEIPLAASFTGTVTDEDGEPVYGAYVYATTSDGENTETAVTDAEGAYTISGLAENSYVLKAAYAYYCPSDPGWVTVWWPDALDYDDARVATLNAGEGRSSVDFVLPKDDDHDGMGDGWERDNGLDPTRDDAAEDPDGDGYANAEEWLLGSDPTSVTIAGKGCGRGCGGSAGILLVLPAFVRRRRKALL